MRSFTRACLLAAVCATLPFVVRSSQQDLNQTPESSKVTVVPLRHVGTTKRLDEMDPHPPQTNESRFQIEKLTFPEERYRLIQRFPGLFYCDPDTYPVEHSSNDHAIQIFSDIESDRPAFQAMAKHLGLEKTAQFSDAQKVLLYQEYKKLRFAIKLEQIGDNLKFSIGALSPPNKKILYPNGQRITGLIESAGDVTILDEVRAVLTCPK